MVFRLTAVTQSTVWCCLPLFDDDLNLLEGIESLPITQFVPAPGIEGLAASVLRRRAGFNVDGFGPHRLGLLPDGLGHELRSII